MSDSNETPKHKHGNLRKVVITDTNSFRMPHKCIVCGTDVSSLYAYTQDHTPIISPGLAIVRTTEVEVPYCKEHQHVFEKRFRTLHIVQNVLYIVLFIGAIALYSTPGRETLGLEPEWGMVEAIVGGGIFLLLAGTIFCVKPFLYDVFLTQSKKHLTIKSRSEIFIQNVIEANSTIVE